MELDILNNGGGINADGGNGKDGNSGQAATSQKFRIRIFINMDEDDDKSIGFSNPSDLFERTDDSLPFYIDVSKENIKCDKKFNLNPIPHIQT